MFVGRPYLIVNKTEQWGKKVDKARIVEFSSSKKVLKFPDWYPADTVDKITKRIKKLPPERKDFYLASEEQCYRLPYRPRGEAIVGIPWEHEYELYEPYSVKFSDYNYLYYPSVPKEQVAPVKVPDKDKPKKVLISCLKKSVKYPKSNREYTGYWFGAFFPTYIRGQVRRAREKREEQAKGIRHSLYLALLNQSEDKVIYSLVKELKSL